jgi:hypothetical protein
MAISLAGLSGGGGAPLNTSQVFKTSGTFTAPADVTNVEVLARGGNGGASSGGASSFNSVSASGGDARVQDEKQNTSGSSYYPPGYGARQVGYGFAFGFGFAGQGAESIKFFSQVTPGNSYSVVVGSGPGSHVVISWSA